MSKTKNKLVFKDYAQGQNTLFPESLNDKIKPGSPVRLINTIVDQLDISSVIDTYKGGGTSSYHPRMLLKVLFFAYLNNIYSCRKIATALEENILYMWLSGKQYPDFRTINTFRSHHLKDNIHTLFTQVVVMLVEMGHISLETQYIDGTKLESPANRYTFVWKKTVEKNKTKLENKIRHILSQIEEGIAGDNQAGEETPAPIDSEELKRRISQINQENKSKAEQKQLRELKDKHLPKLQEYEKHLSIMGDRNSYSKTDPDATFMRMKDDHMGNGQLKPAHNLQIGTENQFITHYDFFYNPGDTLTLKSFLQSNKQSFGVFPKQAVADAGYGSEENYEFMEDNGIEAFVKYNYFHKEQKKSFINNPFLQENLYYNEQKDYFVCPMGQHMKCIGTQTRKSESGYQSRLKLYQAVNCNGCPLRGMCHQSKNHRVISVNHNLREHKRKAKERLMSEQGLGHRSKRPIEPEAVFGQIKFNKQYNRLRHRGVDKIRMDFGILAIAFNLQKLSRKMATAA